MKEKIEKATVTLNNNMIKYIRGFLFEIKRRENFDNDVLAKLLSKSVEEIDDFMNEKWEGTISILTLSKLILLGVPFEEMLYFSLPEETNSEEWLKSIDEYISTFKKVEKVNNTNESTQEKRDEMAKGILRLLNLLNINTPEEVNGLCDIMENLNKDE